MFHLIIDIHQFSQFAIIESELATEIKKSVQSICGKWELEAAPESDYLRYTYSNPLLGQYETFTNVLFSLQDMLGHYEEDLHGYSIILEAVDEKESFSFASLLLKIRERQGIYLGENAVRLISNILSEQVYNGLWKVKGVKRVSDQDRTDAVKWTQQRPFFEDLLDRLTPWINSESPPGETHITGEEANGLHLIGTCLIQQLTAPDAHGKLVYAVLEEQDELLYAITRTINMNKLNWVEENLNDREKNIWEEKQEILRSHAPIISSSFPLCISEKPERDMLIAMQIYLSAYARWSYAQGSLPVVIIYLRRELTAVEQWFLQLLMKGVQLFWFLIAGKDYLPEKALALEKIRIRLPDCDEHEISALIKREELPEEESKYMLEFTKQKSLALYYFVNNKEYFLKIKRIQTHDPGSVDPVQRIIQRSLNLLSPENQELLYILMLIGPYLEREQIFAFFEGRGKLHTDIAEIYKELEKKGFILYEQSIAFRSEIAKLAHNYVNTGLIQDSVQFVLNPDNAVRLQPGLITIISRYNKQQNHLPIIYRYVQMLFDCRLYQKAQKINVNSLSSDARDLINAQLALESGKLSERKIPQVYFTEDLWKGEWLIIQTLLLIQNGNLENAKKSCKEAIILFQRISDEQGLCRANNLFGYLYHRFSKQQEALLYFSFSKNSESMLGEQYIFSARFMSALSNFIQYRYSRVKKELEGENGLLSRLRKNGGHSWLTGAVFLMARTYFALGEYEEAQTLLIRQFNSFRSSHQICELFHAWIARCFIYREKFKTGMAIFDRLAQTEEVCLFRAEAYVLQRQFDDAVMALARTEEKAKSYSFNLLFNWQNGFSWVEDLLISDPDGNSSIMNFRHGIAAFAMGNDDDAEKSIERFHWLTREKKIPSTDPHLSIILYWYARILDKTKYDHEKRDDWLTTLSRAVKTLQERSSMIEESSDKRSFLKKSVWNNELFNMAKDNNLI